MVHRPKTQGTGKAKKDRHEKGSKPFEKQKKRQKPEWVPMGKKKKQP